MVRPIRLLLNFISSCKNPLHRGRGGGIREIQPIESSATVERQFAETISIQYNLSDEDRACELAVQPVTFGKQLNHR
jgi:hypothetical protein